MMLMLLLLTMVKLRYLRLAADNDDDGSQKPITVLGKMSEECDATDDGRSAAVADGNDDDGADDSLGVLLDASRAPPPPPPLASLPLPSPSSRLASKLQGHILLLHWSVCLFAFALNPWNSTCF